MDGFSANYCIDRHYKPKRVYKRSFLKRHIAIIIRSIQIASESIFGRWQTFRAERVVFMIHFRWKIIIRASIFVEIIEFTEVADKFQTDIFERTITVFGDDKFRLPLRRRLLINIPFNYFVVFLTNGINLTSKSKI